jgi:tetratricopeptide (TPR) repeat protein
LLAAGAAALLFGLHPLHVESVAWVAERKDLLCAFFVLLAVLCYLSFTSSTFHKSRRLWYVLCLVSAIFSLLSKPMAVTLPLILLLIDVYPLKRISFRQGNSKNFRSVFLEKAPFFALSIASSIITILAQRSGGALRNLEKFPLDIRLLNALKSLVFYLQKITIPINLIPYYPFPSQIRLLEFDYLVSVLLVFAITSLCLWRAKKGTYLFATVWLFYVVTLLPVLGIIQVGDQSAADRYTYLPSLSIFFLCGAGTLWLLEQNSFENHRVRFATIVLVLSFVFILIGNITRRQITVWSNSETLWEYVIQAFPFPNSGPMAHNNLGTAYYKKGELDKAISEYKLALALRPHYENALNNLGVAYSKKGMVEEAIEQHKIALAINPNSIGALLNLGAAYDTKGELDKAIMAYKKAIALKPNYARAHNNLAVVYFRKANYKLAIFHCDKVVAIRGSGNKTLLEMLKPYRTRNPK